jgi:hypothetical protein
VRCDASKNSPLFELARVLVSLDHIANVIVNANHGSFVVRADEKLTAFVELEFGDLG